MTKTMISLRIDGALYETLKQKHINVSGLVQELLTEWLQKQENDDPIAQQEYNDRLNKCIKEFEYNTFYPIRSKYAEKIIRQALQ
ncbi:type II toxin-antitoxin system CcdA family antitoxin, partial [Caldisphaera sp.]|uniref:type II toxin-antitoxin system CcdA family antitoxin n=1 Tax=Caldisphaera sp. TaxID=2060322 RepID=UPI0025BF603D